jgi:class 3 adenylate cyclase
VRGIARGRAGPSGHAAAGDGAKSAAQPLASPSAEPALRFVSVLFAALVGFTVLSEGREAEDMRELLGRDFLSTRTIVWRWGGVLGVADAFGLAADAVQDAGRADARECHARDAGAPVYAGQTGR